MNVKVLPGLLIGFICRWFDLPLPALSRIVGALPVVETTLGYITASQVSGIWSANSSGGPHKVDQRIKTTFHQNTAN